jgi:GH25 family lysozyme M1 (1,4-beta-N-acetylmuramidase)
VSEPLIHLPGCVPGIDLSGWNKRLDYDAIPLDGVRFAWIKVSQGNDPRGLGAKLASEHARGLEEAGIADVGVYHFAVPSDYPDDPDIEAEVLLRELDDIDARGLRPVLDYERETGDSFDDELWISSWVVRVYDALGILPGIYIGKLARNGKVDLARVCRIIAQALGLEVEFVERELFRWSARYPTTKGRPLAEFHRLAVAQIERGPRIEGWDVWQWTSSWRPKWARGSIDVNAALDMDLIRWRG